jgi:hypothetical protein
MSEWDEEYELARRKVIDAIETGATELDLSGDEFFYSLRRLPPEIALLKDLETLAIGCLGEIDLGPLQGLKKLKTLHMRGGFYGEHGPLPFPELEDLLVSTKYAAMPDLSATRKLRRLTLKYTDERLGLAGLESLHNLEALDIADVSSQPSLFENVGRLRSLKELRAGIDDNDVDVVGRLVQVESLSFVGSSGFTEAGLSALAHLAQLRVLNLDQTGVSDLTPIISFASARSSPSVLERLTYRSTPATKGDAILAELSQLEDVHLSTRLTLIYLQGVSAHRARVHDADSAKDEALRALDALTTATRESADGKPSIGHNNPPETIDRERYVEPAGSKLAEVVRKLRVQIEASNTDHRDVEVGLQSLATARARVLQFLQRLAKEGFDAVAKDATKKIFTLENLWWTLSWAWHAVQNWRGH